MKSVVISYTKLIIPSRKGSPEKVLYCPLLETFLFNKSLQTNFSFHSIVDSGADFCVFPARFGKMIGLDIKKGKSVITFGVGGQEILYFHKIEAGIIIKGELWRFPCMAGFSYKMN